MVLALGIDIGSTTTKVALVSVSSDGRVAEYGHAASPSSARADALVADVLRLCRDHLGVRGRDVAAIGVASMAETGVPVDVDGVALTELLRWDAGHGAQAAAGLSDVAADLFAATGVRVSAKTPLATWVQLLQMRPEVRQRWSCWLSAADIVVHALTGEFVTDHTLAGRTGGYRLPDRGAAPEPRFDDALIAMAGLTVERFPRVAGERESAGPLDGAIARELGLRAGIPVVTAGHDHQVAAWAAGVRVPGAAADSLGTAEAVLSIINDRPEMEAVRAEGMSMVRTVAGRDAIVAGSATAGAMLQHWLDTVPAGKGEGVLSAAARAAAVDQQPTGGAVAPYLRGRQTPAPDPAAPPGTLPPDWTRERQARAVVEGICYQARWMMTRQRELAAVGESTGAAEVTIIGGDRLPRLWTDLKVATSPWPVRFVRASEPVAAGAALLALARSGELGQPSVLLDGAPTLPLTAATSPALDLHLNEFQAFIAAAGG